jgi:hypothetical protein
VNFASALSKMKDNVVRLFAGSLHELLLPFVCAMAAAVEPVRPNRSFPRNLHTTNPNRYHPTFMSAPSTPLGMKAAGLTFAVT